MMWHIYDVTYLWCDIFMMWHIYDVTFMMWHIYDVTYLWCDIFMMWHIYDVGIFMWNKNNKKFHKIFQTFSFYQFLKNKNGISSQILVNHFLKWHDAHFLLIKLIEYYFSNVILKPAFPLFSEFCEFAEAAGSLTQKLSSQRMPEKCNFCTFVTTKEIMTLWPLTRSGNLRIYTSVIHNSVI
jgi:hypothetical protein